MIDLGFNHIVKANGSVVKATWELINPNAIFGGDLLMMTYSNKMSEEDINDTDKAEDYNLTVDVKSLFDKPIISGMVYTFNTTCVVSLTPVAGTNGDLMHSFTLVNKQSGEVWAICNFEEVVQLQSDKNTWFELETSLQVINHQNLSTDLWKDRIGGGVLVYSAMLELGPTKKGVSLAQHQLIDPELPDDHLFRLIDEGNECGVTAEFNGAFIGVGICGKGCAGQPIKLIYVNLLWNLGMYVYVDTVDIYGQEQSSIEMDESEELVINFQLNSVVIK